ncbi:MAG: beta-ketoacyl-ACP synthase II [Clostridia bacterium]|nr:beta-ketoacyl-ACP synthase II [Clostridia bacterium]
MKRVVVTGMGVVSPVGNTLHDFWKNLTDGVCGIDFITKFDATDFKVKIAAEVKDFDPLNYMDRNSARRMDLFSQYAMAAAVTAVEDSGIENKADKSRLGVYIGSGIGGLTTFVKETEKGFQKGYQRVSPLFIPMMISNIASGNVAIRFNAQGVNLPTVTACATSTSALGEAFRAIKYGHADAIISGGCEASIIPIAVAGFTNCMALSLKNQPKSSSTPFDLNRDGFVMGEGGAVLILEEYQHALNRGAKIYAEICGYGNTCDAYHITAPQPDAEASSKAIRLAYDEGGLSENDTICINPHGTSTPLNDKTETIAIKKALGDKAYDCYIGATKSMTGHMLGAAGAAEAIAAVMAIKTGTVPPTIGFNTPDPECNLNYVFNKSVNASLTAALSISLGFGGHNSCLAFKAFKE